MFAAVTRTGVGHDHAHAAFGDTERVGQLAAHTEWNLRSGPDGQVAVRPFGDGRARFERSMCDVRDLIGGVQRVIGRGQSLLHDDSLGCFRSVVVKSAFL